LGGILTRFFVFALVVSGLNIAAKADDLVMPYACAPSGADVRVVPANDTSYRIFGQREEQPFALCTGRPDACETMMVHRFLIECDGVKVSWSRVAVAAKALGVVVPAGLPVGFAPVSPLSGRFVLPGLARTAPLSAHVSKQEMSADSVFERPDDAERGAAPAWITVVQSDILNSASATPAAARLAASLAAVMVMLVAAALVAAGRWRLPGVDFARLSAIIDAAKNQVISASPTRHWRELLRRYLEPADETSATTASNAMTQARAMLAARLVETELLVASLPADLLLRDVLASEVQSVRQRLAGIDRRRSGSSENSVAIMRGVVRDLDRIIRIGQSALQGTAEIRPVELDMPRSSAEAYRVLGINADAAPQVAKKLVDALRMSWHPDHARDENDRAGREERTKQINAAWDLIKTRRAAA
jgi:hypothetical protein